MEKRNPYQSKSRRRRPQPMLASVSSPVYSTSYLSMDSEGIMLGSAHAYTTHGMWRINLIFEQLQPKLSSLRPHNRLYFRKHNRIAQFCYDYVSNVVEKRSPYRSTNRRRHRFVSDVQYILYLSKTVKGLEKMKEIIITRHNWGQQGTRPAKCNTTEPILFKLLSVVWELVDLITELIHLQHFMIAVCERGTALSLSKLCNFLKETVNWDHIMESQNG
jgi:hypothetical protein